MSTRIFKVAILLSSITVVVGFIIAAILLNDSPRYEDIMKQAEQGNPTSQFAVAFLYKNGVSVEKNELKARYWLNQAATNGSIDAQITLGNAYSVGGWGVEKDLNAAREWYAIAQKNGSKSAESLILGLD